MSKQAVQTQATVKATPAPTGTLQRQCACGQHTNGGECETCNGEQEGLIQRSAISAMPAARVPYNAYPLFHSLNPQMSAETRTSMESRPGRDFSRIPTNTFARPVIQPKLAINQPGDSYEQEADRIADQVVTSPASESVSDAPPQIQRYSEEPGAQTEMAPAGLDQSPLNFGSPLETGVSQETEQQSRVETQILSSQGQGAPLPAATRAIMEDSLKSDLGKVRVHTDAAADTLNTTLHSYAFTTGKDIYFANGQYRPGTIEGDRLIAHELVHTIQQGASRRQVQRKDWGTERHDDIQELLRAANKSLITEAPIPGAAPSKTKIAPVGRMHTDPAKMGFADLFMSEGGVIPGVRGDKGSQGLIIRNITPLDMRGHSPQSQTKIESKPRRAGRGWTLLPGFPNFKVGEIKPLMAPGEWQFPLKLDLSQDPSFQRLGYAEAQAGTLKSGLEEFVPVVYQESGGKTRASTSGSLLDTGSDISIPPEIDYRQFDNQLSSAKAQVHQYRAEKRRLWVYPWRPGVLAYFELGHPLINIADIKRIDTLITALDASEKKFPQKPAPLPNKVTVAPKRRPGAPALLLQRKDIETTPIPDAKTNTAWTAWKTEFEEWNNGTKDQPGGAKAFLKDKEGGRWQLAKLEIDSKLGIKKALTPKQKNLKKIARWSRMGLVLGWLRFKFGWLFQKIQGLFAKLRDRLASFQKKATDETKGGEGGGWEGAALALIKRLFVGFLKDLAGEAFQIIANCVTGVIGKAFDSFVDEVREDLDEFLNGIHDKFQAFHDRFVSRYEPVIALAEKVINTFHNVMSTLSILKDVERALRLLVEAISCVTPPALGCLWGLVAQVAFDEIASRAINSDTFENKIARPAAKQVIEKSGVGNVIRGLLEKLFAGIGLDDFTKDVPDCARKIPGTAAGDMKIGDSFDPNAPEIAKMRGEIQKQHSKEEMTRDLEKTLNATPEQIQDLVDIIHDSNKSPDEIKKIVEQSKGRGKKPFNAEQAEGQLSRLASLSNTEVVAILEKADWKKVTRPGEFIVDDSQSQPLLLGELPSGEHIGSVIEVRSENNQGQRAYRIVDCTDLIILSKSDMDAIQIPFRDDSGKLSEQSFSFGPFNKGDVILSAEVLRGRKAPGR